jgi:hypothetical protein
MCVNIDDMVYYFNQLLELDRVSINKLFLDNHVVVNDHIIDHEYAQVRVDGKFGILGLINGIFIPYDQVIYMDLDEKENIIKFRSSKYKND